MHGDDAVAAAQGGVGVFVITWGIIDPSVPNIAIATFVVAEFVSNLFVYYKVQVEDAVATAGGLQAELPVVHTRVVIHKTESIAIVHARLTLPATAVVDGDVVVGVGCDVNQQRVLTFAVYGVVYKLGQDGVVVDTNVVEAMARVKLAFANFIAFRYVLLCGIDVEIGGVAGCASAAAFIGGDEQGCVVDASLVIGVCHGVLGAGGAVAEVP